MMKMSSRHSGFSLIEVLVALLVVGIVLPALVISVYQQLDGTAYLRDKAIAQWVAGNKLAETRIQLARTNSIFRGERNGVDTMGERDWYWWMTSETTPVEDFYRLEITVATEETSRDSPVYTLVGFLHAQSVASGER